MSDCYPAKEIRFCPFCGRYHIQHIEHSAYQCAYEECGKLFRVHRVDADTINAALAKAEPKEGKGV